MALLSPQLQRFLLTRLSYNSNSKPIVNRTTSLITGTTVIATTKSATTRAKTLQCCSAIAIEAPGSASLSGVDGIRLGSVSLQGPREEMEDEVVIQTDGLDGFSFAAVFDGHGGVSSVKFLRDELYKECVAALQGALRLSGKDFNTISKALQEAFRSADTKLLNWIEMNDEDDESGATATVMFLGSDILFISHIGDSSVVLSRSGNADILNNPHRPYGSSKVALQEIRRIREAGGWIVNGRICGDIAVSRAFGDIRFKTKKNEMLKKGVNEGKWSEKFVSRVQLKDDLVIASPDIFQVALGSDAEFVLLASDGLWDYMDSSDAVQFVRNQLQQHGDVQLACEALAQAALDRRSQDNISIVIADLGRTDWKNLPLQQGNFVYEFAQAFATIGIVSLAIWMTSQLSL